MAVSDKVKADFRISHLLPWALRLPDSTYECTDGHNHYSLTTKTHESTIGEDTTEGATFMVRAMTGQITEASKTHIPGAMLRYTEVTITFSKKIPESAVRQADIKDVLSLAHRFLNRFLDCYRLITRDSEVRPLTRAEFHQVRGGRALSVWCNVKRSNGTGTLGAGVFFDEENPIVIGNSKPLTESEVTELRKHLRAGEIPALAPLLLLNAEMYLRSGQNKLAVIEMNTAFDILVEQKAKALLVHLGQTPSDVENELERKNTTAIVKTFLLPNIDPPSANDFPWDEWYTKYRPLRNRVVHDGYEPEVEEAQNSLANLRKMCNFISSLQIVQ